MKLTPDGVAALLASLRVDASEKLTKGPTVLIAGPTDAGKSSLSRRLLWQALVERDHPILFADVDIGQGEISLPGTIGATEVSSSSMRSIDGVSPAVEDRERYGEMHNYPLQWTNELVYYIGHTNMSEKDWLFKWYISQLAARLSERQASGPQLAASGIVVNTCGWVEGQGYRLLLDCIRAFQPSHVLVLGDTKLYDQLVHEQAAPSVVMLPRSHQATRRSAAYRREARVAKIQQYFSRHVPPAMPFFQVQVPFDAAAFYRLVQNNRQEMQVKKETLIESMAHTIVAMCKTPPADAHLIRATVMGFLCIRSINKRSKTLVFVSPCAGTTLPSKHFLLGQIEWIAA
ncbi:Aste57867_23833 [Aphanomyces stellatus]|uniref:Aste57867_23833 protein n=1 Tax=Aphanomyces stellatus TaxID=120398 RepID=A0A485LQD9_9STRA|nr:hypothetical protein As57867_023760 [Aphanomyces stellatus]VFU00477.1 Aste57867_23833 [Aphanomyces stellatus]